MKSYQLHSAPNRRKVFEQLSPKIWWEHDVLKTLVVADPVVAAEILRSPFYVVPDLRQIVSKIEQRYATPLDYIRKSMDILPLFLEGKPRVELRKLFGQFLSGKLRGLEPQLDSMVARALVPLERDGEVELMSEVIRPLVKDVMSSLAGVELTDTIMKLQLGGIFQVNKNVSGLKKLQQTFKEVFEFLETGNPKADLFVCRLCCVVFGSDNLQSTIAENIMAVSEQTNTGVPLELPSYPVETALSATFRRPIHAFEVAGFQVEPDELIRIQLEPFGYGTGSEITNMMFGAGAHACIGKQVSLRVWSQFSKHFNRLRVVGEVLAYHAETTHSLNFVQSLKMAVVR